MVEEKWKDNQVVEEEDVAVTVNFGDEPEDLKNPYDEILTFVDPSVEFGLRFETQDDEDGASVPGATADILPSAPATTPKPVSDDAKKDEDGKEAEIVSLDSFRK